MTIVLKTQIHFRQGKAGQKELQVGAEIPSKLPSGRLPRLTRLMALALKFDDLLRRGEIRDCATLAKLGRITRARVSQIMTLTLLAPDLIEEILFLPRIEQGREPLVLGDLQKLTQEASWPEQRRLWKKLRQRRTQPK